MRPVFSHHFAPIRQVLVKDRGEELPSTGGVDLNPPPSERFQARDPSDLVEVLGITGSQQRQPNLAGRSLTHHPGNVGSQAHGLNSCSRSTLICRFSAAASSTWTVLCHACRVDSGLGGAQRQVLDTLASLRQHQRGGQRSPHKPLLVLLALGRLAATGSSELPWPEAEVQLADLIAEFGPPSRTSRAQSAAYPFTRLRADGVWVLDQDVQMDLVGPLAGQHVTGRLEPAMESVLRDDPALIRTAARALVLSNFPETVAPDVLTAAGLDPDDVLNAADDRGDGRRTGVQRRRNPAWRSAVLQAWDRQCAFCGYDGQLGGASAGIDAAHVRWFTFDGPDDLDNGLALCALHHKLFDLGALGLDLKLRVLVSAVFTARTSAGRAVYDLHERLLTPRPGAITPSADHITWHTREVFKGKPLAA